MQKQIQNRNRFNLKNWLLALGCLAGPMLYAGDDYFSDDEDDDYLSLEDWYKLEDWEKASSFGALSEDEQESVRPQLSDNLTRAIIARAFKDEPEGDRLKYWYRVKREAKVDPELESLLFGGLSKKDQLRVWKGADSAERSLYFRHLHNSLRQQLFFDLDEAMQAKYLSEHHQASKVRF